MNTHKVDVLIEGGTVVDGTGSPPVPGNIGIVGDRIDLIGQVNSVDAQTRIDARGLVVAPGFIDAHTHDDRLALSSPDMTPKISQGVTTVISGNCGISLAPLVGIDPPPPLNLLGNKQWFRFPSVESYATTLDENPPALNIAMLVGHSTLRVGVMDDLNREANPSELDRMGELLEVSLQAGCIGMSTGLAYPTAEAASAKEVTALVERLVPYNAVYTTHMRDERDHVVESVKETLDVGRSSGARVVISHHKCGGRQNWGRTKQTLALIEAAKSEQSINLDVYPYTASSTVLLRDFIESSERVIVTWSEPHPEMAGRDFDDIKNEWNCSTEVAIKRLLPAGAIYHQMHEEDLRRVLKFKDVMIGSDGLPHDEFPHPRLWGTFPRVLGHYCREQGLFPVEEAIRRMTSVPASVFNLKDRGVLCRGSFADVVLFDANNVIDKADYNSPTRVSNGIHTVMVNGQVVWREQKWTKKCPGRLLRRV